MCQSPRKKKKRANLMADLNDDNDDRAAAETAETDRVAVEVVAWKNISADRIKQLTDESGLINEFKLVYSVREEMP